MIDDYDDNLTDLERNVRRCPEIIWDSTIRCWRILYLTKRGVCVKGLYGYKINAEKALKKLKK